MTSEELELRWQVEAMARDVVSTMSDGDRRKARRAIDASLRAWQNEQVANRQRGSPLRHHEDSALYMFAQLSEKTPAERAVFLRCGVRRHRKHGGEILCACA